MHHHTVFASAVQPSLSSSAPSAPDFSVTSPLSLLDTGERAHECALAHHSPARFALPIEASSSLLGRVWDTLPLVSNTGGKSLKVANYDAPALQIKGANQRYSIQIDTLTFSFSGGVFGFDIAPVRKWLVRWSRDALTIGGKLRARYNGYEECWDIVPGDSLDKEAPPLGWLGVSRPSDNMRGRWCFHLTGVGCAFVSDWSCLAADLPAYFAKITRVDVALDDLEGKHSVALARRLWDEGAFNLSGRPPMFRYIQTSHNAGDTFYVGLRESGKQLRVYEKGKQLAGGGKVEVTSDAINWVRWEVELRAQSRRIPSDVLLHPAAYLKGAYPSALAWMSGAGVKLSTMVEKTLLTFDRVMSFAKRQAGRVVRYCVDNGLSPDAIVSALIAPPGWYPVRLFNPAVSIDWGTGEYIAAGAGGCPASIIP